MKVLVPLSLVVFAASCSSDDGGVGMCMEGERTLAILEPADGAMLTMEDDIDPAMGGVQVQVTVASCGFEPEEEIGVYLLDPVETPYAYLTAGTGTSSDIIPLVPGTLRMEARSMDESVRSPTITIDVTLD